MNVLVSMVIHPPKAAINPLLYAGFALVSIGAAHGAVLPADGVAAPSFRPAPKCFGEPAP